MEWLKTVYGKGTTATPQQLYATFLRTTPNALPPLSDDDISAIKSSMTERPPYEPDIPLKEMAKTSYPKLVISGKRQREGQGPALVKICDILEKELGAQRVTIEGATHNPQLSYPEQFNNVLREFLDTASRHKQPTQRRTANLATQPPEL